MVDNEYVEFVKSRVKNGEDILDSLDSDKCHLMHMAIGISGEAGELLDAIKKHVIYGKDLDVVNINEEIGDLLFYITGLATSLDMDVRDCAIANEEKLRRRYPKGYSDKSAIERKDKM